VIDKMKKAGVWIGGGVMMIGAALIVAAWSQVTQKGITALTPDELKWFTPSYYKDGRQRAKIYGDSDQGGAWIDRVKIPAGLRIAAHTHPHDELVTVVEGTWYVGEGRNFDPDKLKAYPAGSFILIPAGLPHFVAAKDSPVVIQLSGNGKFGTDYLEK
jgi:quercetin dioxygenase-like cupin family protein